MSRFIKLMLFIEQSKGAKNSFGAASMPAPTPKVPMAQWKVGYIIKGTTSGEEFTIREIKSKDGAMHHEDCSVVLVGVDSETRELKSSSMRSGRYEYVSSGDAEPPKGPEVVTMREDCMPFIVNIAGIREFYPRKRGEGTRVLMLDKTAYIVADEFGAMEVMIKKAGGVIANGTKVIGETNAADPVGGVA
jgi:hypothetical protein